ncbi:LysM peptidoglycan-binding domain-containing protein [Niallia sp. NCCP-28]|uniref:C40 family peptidase n=1 Tax=Niallia sp. NCCP-28 TaxID=2934712 RepID=UPI00207DAA2C|nr:peptidoglycan endopeptidase [Niallia sp. NCCP-28]GKU83641.1 putative peptidoglycan endopeptidase LytE [Niallia sp. NCCP-28]
MKKKITALATLAIFSSAFTAHASASTYVVKKGDTLSKIAKQYSTTVTNLKTANKLASDTIYINQKLNLSGNSIQKQTSAASSSVETKTTTAAKTYKIVAGDTLSKIANKFSISLSNLKSWNNITSDLIFPGNTLVVSKPSNTANLNTSSVSTSKTTTNTTNSDSYTIKSGDTLGKIAAQYNLSVSQLKKLNNLTSDLIFAGKKLKVTGTPSSNSSNESSNVESSNSSSTVKVSNQNNSSVASGDIVSTAKQLIGIPYSWGGTSTSGFDCSGFIYYVLNQSGKSINRYSAQGYYDRSYYVDAPKIGDLVFFEGTYKAGISHLGIYIGGNQFIHADSSGVRITSLDNSYYKNHFASFKRLY